MGVIRQFLDLPGFDFEAGRKLYQEYGNDGGLKFLFSLGDTPHNRQQLIKELTYLADKEKPTKSTKATHNLAPVIPSKKVDIDYDALPPLLKQRNVDKGVLYYEMQHLHLLMCQANTNEERARLRADIIQKNTLIKGIWRELDYYQEHKKLLYEPAGHISVPVAIINEENNVDLMRRLFNVRAHISKLKKNKDKAELLKKKLDEKTELEAKLGIAKK